MRLLPRWIFRRQRLVILLGTVGILFVMYQLFSVRQLGFEMSRRNKQNRLRRNFREYEKADSFVDFKRLFPDSPVNEQAEQNLEPPVRVNPASNDNDKKPEDLKKNVTDSKKSSRSEKLRGIHPLKENLYIPVENGVFYCISNKKKISFSQVNDDYCDCEDGSDEPSTSACLDNLFYCTFQHKNSNGNFVFVKSAKVNDGICDCCDGSDEWKNVQLPVHLVLSEDIQAKLGSFQTPCKMRCPES